MKSPCVRICVVHPGTSFCVGCLRTTAEIAGWTAMSDAERDAVMADLPTRQNAHKARAARPSQRRKAARGAQ